MPMTDLVINENEYSVITQNSKKLMLIVFMVLMASNGHSEVNMKSESARLIGTLRSHVVMGSSPHEVIEILTLHDIEHSAYQKKKATIDAIVRDIVTSEIGSASIKIRFVFENDRLTSYTLEKTYTRPQLSH
jgi:hypothetical protein